MNERNVIKLDILIEEVRKRPPVWNVFCSEYHNTYVRNICWREIVEVMSPNLTTEDQKRNYGLLLMHKWKKVFHRYAKQMEVNMRSGSRKKKSSVHAEKLRFLDDSIGHLFRTLGPYVGNAAESVAEFAEVPYFQNAEQRALIAEARVANMCEVIMAERRLNEEDEDRRFFMSLIPWLQNLPLPTKLLVQIVIMEIVRKVNEYFPVNTY